MGLMERLRISSALAGLAVMGAGMVAAKAADGTNSAVLRTGFIYESAPFPSAHASTIVESGDGLVCSWFGGSDEGEPDVGIWVSRMEGGKWSVPVEVATVVEEGSPRRYPCWNPVLFQARNGPLILWYKVGPSPRDWWGLMITSSDQGRTWSPPKRLPAECVGPVRNKPVELGEGRVLCGSSTEDHGWRVHMERTDNAGREWARTPALNDGSQLGLIQPTILKWPSGRVQILCRSRQGWVFESTMGADWRSWSAFRALGVPNPNSGIDGLVLQDGRGLLVYNPVKSGRTPLSVGVSPDGEAWREVLQLEKEPGEYSYPAVIQSRDGRVHVTYTWKRLRIKHAVLDPARL